MERLSLREVVDVHGPFVSVYLPPNANTLMWQALRGQLVAESLDDRTLTALDEATMTVPDGMPGRALIAAEGVTLVNEAPSWAPPQPLARLSDLPYLLPLAPRHSVREPAGALVSTGGVGIDIGVDEAARGRSFFDQFLFEFSRPDGPAVDGLRACTETLRDHNADALIIAPGQLGDRTVWVGGTRHDQVAEDPALRGTGLPVSQQRADEALPMAALAVGAEVLIAPDDLPMTDGVGVLLRHPRD
jgi:hypothetical protein